MRRLSRPRSKQPRGARGSAKPGRSEFARGMSTRIQEGAQKVTISARDLAAGWETGLWEAPRAIVARCNGRVQSDNVWRE